MDGTPADDAAESGAAETGADPSDEGARDHEAPEAAPYGIVVAVARDGVIGRDDDLPWHHPEDLKHFKRTTLGHALVMGRKTWESFGAKPLPRRRHLIVSRSVGADADAVLPEGAERDGARWFGSVDAAVAWWRAHPVGGSAARPGANGANDASHAEAERLFVIGGGQIFAQVLDESGPLPDPLVITWVPAVGRQDGDVLFPVDRDWIEKRYTTAATRPGEDEGLEFVEYRLIPR